MCFISFREVFFLLRTAKATILRIQAHNKTVQEKQISLEIKAIRLCSQWTEIVDTIL